MTWTYNGTTGAYLLNTPNATLFVRPTGMVYTEERDGAKWTCSIGSGGGERWKDAGHGLTFEKVSSEDAVKKIIAYESSFKTPGLPAEQERDVEVFFKWLKEANRPKVQQ